MDLLNSKISAKLSKPYSILYQKQSPSDDYELDVAKLWTPISQFQILEKSFDFFSTEELFSGILFCKSKKPHLAQWFKARFFRLYKDRLVLYSVSKIKKKKFKNFQEKRPPKTKKSDFAQRRSFKSP